MADWIGILQDMLGKDAVVTDPSELKELGRDWTRFHEPHASAAALPRTAEDVARVLAFCNEHGIQVVPSGGRTGLAAGAVATKGELILSLSRINHIGAVDMLSRTVRVGAGAVHQRVQESVHSSGLHWPVDLAAKGTCQIGGNLATNAGGLRVIRYGHARQWAQSVRVALMDGTLLELHGDLEKNNTGYDLRDLIIGSEGTLGIIVEATLKLAPIPKASKVVLAACAEFEGVLETLLEAREKRWPLLSRETFSRDCLGVVREVQGFPTPFPDQESSADFYVLMELEDESEIDVESSLSKLMEGGDILDATVNETASGARDLWRYRETITESLSRKGQIYKNDLAFPLRNLKSFIDGLTENAPTWYPGCRVFLFGHVGDGNLHVNVWNAANLESDKFLALCEAANHKVFALVQKLGGSIAAEHGIGLLKKSFLSYSRSPREIDMMRSIKRSFDPKGLLNPGKIFDL